jgi:hypothetical protein
LREVQLCNVHKFINPPLGLPENLLYVTQSRQVFSLGDFA